MAALLPDAYLRKFSHGCRMVLGAVLGLMITAAAGLAQAQTMSASEAYSAVLNDDVIILDIRSPGEWAETGVAKGAWPVTKHDPSFGPNLQRILEKHPNKPLALICATGGRSNYVAGILRERGLLGTIDIAEGMFGNGDAPGWIAGNLPVVDIATANAEFTASMLKPE